jgi:nitrogen-specific signal transduction histidine kinase
MGIKGRIAFVFAVAIAVAAICSGALWLYASQAVTAAKNAAEFEAYRQASTLIEEYLSSGAVKAGNGVSFAIYAADGQTLYSVGNAPASFDPSGFRPGQMKIVERTGFVAVFRAVPVRPEVPFPGASPSQGLPPLPEGMGQMPGRNMGPWGNGAGRTGFAFAEFPSADLREGGRFVAFITWIASVALFACALLVGFSYSRSERQRAKAAKDEELVALGEAARTLAHEIKNPLGVIRIQCANLRRGMSPAGVDVIEEETIRLAKLADRVREFLRFEEPAREPLDVAEMMAKLRERYSTSLVVDVPAIPMLASASPEALIEALDNVVRNALEAGGRALPTASAYRKGKRVCISIRDFGMGIAADHRARLFEPFFTTKETGTGIGLAISRKRVRAFGGDLRYIPQPDGSEFVIELPI